MASKRNPVQAVTYLRTSSAANVGADKDSEKRQRAAQDRGKRLAILAGGGLPVSVAK